MGTRPMLSGPQTKSTPERRVGLGRLEVKKEFRIKKETQDDEIKEYAETAMNELLGWYGYDKVDSRDTQGLDLHHFGGRRMVGGRRSPSDADSSDMEGPRNSSSPIRREASSRASPSLPEPTPPAAGCIICSWCNKIVSHKMFSLKTPNGEKSFCSELCFAQCRRANFKRNKTCDWCRHIRHTVNYVDFQDGEHQLQFCSDKCLNQYKMNIFCKETEAHLQLHPHLQGLGNAGTGSGNSSLRLITPELWLRDCRSESPGSDRSVSPPQSSSPVEIKVMPRPPSEVPHSPLKPPPPSLEITKIDKKYRKSHLVNKNKRQSRYLLGMGDRRKTSSPRSGDSMTPPKPSVFPPPLLPLNGNQVPHPPPHPGLPPDHPLLRPPFVPLGCFPPAQGFPADPPPARPPRMYDQVPRPPTVSPPSPSNPTVIPPPPRPSVPFPSKSLLPPVTILVPYPIALAIPIPLPIPIPIPLLPKKATESARAEEGDVAEVPTELPAKPEEEPPPAVPRPLRKRKRPAEAPPEEDASSIAKRKTVPV